MIQTPKITYYTIAAKKIRKHSYSATIALAVLLLVFPPVISNLYNYHTSFAASPNVSFAPVVNYPTGSSVFDFQSGPISGDFNNDGNLDIAKSNYDTDNISVLLGNGDGTFAPAVNYATGDGPVLVLAQDLNDDNVQDLIVPNSDGNNISILMGNSDGTFDSAVNYSVDTRPSFVILSDLNGDSKLDLVTTNQAGTISVLLGNGDGTFDAATNYAVGVNTYGSTLVAEDFNHDGFLDLAVGFGGHIAILIGNGDGTFASAVNYAITGSNWQDMLVGDLNNDNNIDLISVNAHDSSISVLLGNSDGTFDAKVDYAVGDQAYGGSLMDLNDDGNLDAVIMNGVSNSVGVLIGNGDGTFDSMVSYPVGSSPYASDVAESDFNGDGKNDLAVPNDGESSISILPGNGDGTFGTAANFTVDASPDGTMLVGDFNNDGLPDLANVAFGANLSVLINNTQLLTVAFPSPTGSGAEAVANPSIPVNLSEASGTDVTVHYAVTGGTATGGGVDYTLADGDLTIPAGETTGNIPLNVVDNSTVEPDETVIITLSSPSGAILGANTTFTYTIANDDHTAGGGSGGGGSSTPPNGGQTPPPGLQFPPNYVPPTDNGKSTGGGITGSTGSDTSINQATIKFTRNLGFGDNGVDVKDLQKFLNNNGITLAASGPGAPGHETTLFRDRTKQAVKTFQEKFAAQILAPLGLTTGTGFFGDSTRSFVNSFFK